MSARHFCASAEAPQYDATYCQIDKMPLPMRCEVFRVLILAILYRLTLLFTICRGAEVADGYRSPVSCRAGFAGLAASGA